MLNVAFGVVRDAGCQRLIKISREDVSRKTDLRQVQCRLLARCGGPTRRDHEQMNDIIIVRRHTSFIYTWRQPAIDKQPVGGKRQRECALMPDSDVAT